MSLNIVNVYVPPSTPTVPILPQHITSTPTLLVGDLNARHPRLGSQGPHSNSRGNSWLSYLQTTDDPVRLLCPPSPTHIGGGKLDYVALYSDPHRPHSTRILHSLHSDHFPIHSTLQFTRVPAPPRCPRLRLPPSDVPAFIAAIAEWFKSYTVTTADQLYLDLSKQCTDLLRTVPKHRRPNRKPRNRWNVNRDPLVRAIREWHQLAVAQWKKTPRSPDALRFLMRTNKELQSAITLAREKLWFDFASSIDQSTCLGDIWRTINRARGTTARAALHPRPAVRAEALSQTWWEAASIDALPPAVRDLTLALQPQRRRRISEYQDLPADTDVSFTRCELLNAIKRGRSTAPGDDGVTYDVLNALVATPGDPLLCLFNLSYATGRLPHAWKTATTIPVPKPGKQDEYRPISLLSCFSKMMERMIRHRLHWTIEAHLHPDLYGFRPGKSTAHCIAHYLVNTSAKTSLFVDFKGAFDKANGDVILEGLTHMDVKGKLLTWIADYLSHRRTRVRFQGHYSTIRTLDLGTPQGGVLSPTLFNVLMNSVCHLNDTFAERALDGRIISYADDLLLQITTMQHEQPILSTFARTCQTLGLVISHTKTKFISHSRRQTPLTLQGQAIEQVHTYRYLGLPVRATTRATTSSVVAHVISQCRQRTRPLQSLTRGLQGASVRVLRLMYIAIVRAVIDYASPVLAVASPREKQDIEKIQNRAMRLILGCPTTTRIEIMQRELLLLPVCDRITALNAILGVKLLRSEQPTPLSRSLHSHLNTLMRQPGPTTRPMLSRHWPVLTAADILRYHLYTPSTSLPPEYTHPPLPPWTSPSVDVVIHTFPGRKSTQLRYILKLKCLERLDHAASSLKTPYPPLLVYCDGSVDTLGGAGAAVWIPECQARRKIRVHDWASSTDTESIAILAGVHEGTPYARKERRNLLIISDSTSALARLKCPSPSSPAAQHTLAAVTGLEQTDDIRVKFIWIPSHIGIAACDTVDRLAKEATQEDDIEATIALSLHHLKSRIHFAQRDAFDEHWTHLKHRGSDSIRHYDAVTGGNNRHYKEYQPLTRSQQIVYTRLRLGYRYLWQYLDNPEPSRTVCKLCGQADSHTLSHYILVCPMTSSYRSPAVSNTSSLPDQISLLLETGLALDFIRDLPRFAMNR